MEAAFVGNITFDIFCYPVDHVSRYDSLPFDEIYVGLGSCGSNVAIGLRELGVKKALNGVPGEDQSAKLTKNYWGKYRIDQS